MTAVTLIGTPDPAPRSRSTNYYAPPVNTLTFAMRNVTQRVNTATTAIQAHMLAGKDLRSL